MENIYPYLVRRTKKGWVAEAQGGENNVVNVYCYDCCCRCLLLNFRSVFTPFFSFSSLFQAPTTTTTTATVLIVADMMLTSWLVAGYHCLPIRIVFYPDDGDDGFTTNVDWPSSRTW